MLKYDRNEPGYVLAKQSYTGEWERSYIRNNKSLSKELRLTPNYKEAVPLKQSKIRHLSNLSKYIKKPDNINFYNRLLNTDKHGSDDNDVEIDNDDNSSGNSDVE